MVQSRIPAGVLATTGAERIAEDVAEPERKNGHKTKRRRHKRRRSTMSSAQRAGRPSHVAPFPRITLEEALSLGTAIQEHAPGQKIRRATLFEKLNKSPDSGPSRALITNSGKYGITTGSYKADYLELTPTGAKATDPETSDVERLRARFELAIKGVPAFNFLYESLKEKRIPSP